MCAQAARVPIASSREAGVRADCVAYETAPWLIMPLLGRYLVRNSDGSLIDVPEIPRRRRFSPPLPSISTETIVIDLCAK